jgi:ribosomal protein S18 acetylase RimI-like enzyme
MTDRSAPEVSIRYGTSADNTLLANLGRETFYETFAADNTPGNMAAYLAESFGPEKQARKLADPATRFLIAEAEGLAIGYACLTSGQAPPTIVSHRPMEIVRFYVRNAWTGKSVGARLMQACLREAEIAASSVVWLDVWERNLRAIAFYRQWGFAEVGTQPFQLGDDIQRDLLMARPLITRQP